jgi:signal transduction histidine kinase
VATHVFRIAQEAVQNAVRHGKAQEIIVTLSQYDGHVRLVVCDNGQGLREDRSSTGMGLRIMGFRAKMIRAMLEFGEVDGGGCRVVLTLPPDVVAAAA